MFKKKTAKRCKACGEGTVKLERPVCKRCGGEEWELEGQEHTPAELAEMTSSLRNALRSSYPEIDELYSDAYLARVLAVPGRTFEYARDEKISKALAWRREFGVHELAQSVQCQEDGTWSAGAGTDTNASLLETCREGFLRWSGNDLEGRPVLCCQTSLIDWRKRGVEVELQHHVMVIEHGLRLMRQRGEHESFTVVLDTRGGSSMDRPPPMDALRGLSTLLQCAYPDRVEHVWAAPVSGALRALFGLVTPLLASRSVKKISLLRSMEQAPVRWPASEESVA